MQHTSASRTCLKHDTACTNYMYRCELLTQHGLLVQYYTMRVLWYNYKMPPGCFFCYVDCTCCTVFALGLVCAGVYAIKSSFVDLIPTGGRLQDYKDSAHCVFVRLCCVNTLSPLLNLTSTMLPQGSFQVSVVHDNSTFVLTRALRVDQA